MPANYVLLEKITVGSAGASSVTFSGIPQTGYTDLVVKFSGRSARGGAYEDSLKIQFNGDTGSNYSSRILQQYNSTASSAAETSVGYATIYSALDGASATANTFGNGEIYIPNYTSSNAKSFSIDAVSETNGTQGSDDMSANLWTGTAAISSITLFPYFSTFVQYSTFYLYGVAKLGTTPAIVPYATGGDTIMTDGTYWYHTFLSSGTFTPQKAITCDYLVVAGGGSGGGASAADSGEGGGGAGGLRSTVTATGGGGTLETALSLALNTAYTVTVGAGGAGSSTGSSGNNSVFSTITSTGGGRGGNQTIHNGTLGGSGGGARGSGSSTYTGGAGTANQGYAGGNATGNSTYEPGGGGGGAGAVGNNGLSSVAGAGGAGVATSISGSSVTYAGGGGGGIYGNGTPGAGGSGGGGAGTYNAAGVNGTANTGGGGGGAGTGNAGYNGGSGGSGLVIVRYAV